MSHKSLRPDFEPEERLGKEKTGKENDANCVESRTDTSDANQSHNYATIKENNGRISSRYAFTGLTSLQQSTLLKIQTRLFQNTLISQSDLLADDFDYDPESINNIDRFNGTDRWFCKNCTMKDDKWGMMKHPCKNNKTTEKK